MSDDVPTEAPELSTLLRIFGESLVDSLRVMLPGRITEYDAARQLASVQPLITHPYVDESGTRVSKPLPIIHTVPVVFCGTARGRITWPVAVGDTCEIRFASSSIARWVLRGGGPLDPGDDRRHDLNDAICMVGLHDAAHVPTDAPADAIVTHGATRLGGSDASTSAHSIAIAATLNKFMQVLNTVTDSAGACTALHTALVSAGWPAAWVATLAKAK